LVFADASPAATSPDAFDADELAESRSDWMLDSVDADPLDAGAADVTAAGAFGVATDAG
jgi:hypothetical protein